MVAVGSLLAAQKRRSQGMGERPSPTASASIPAMKSRLQPAVHLSNTHLTETRPAARPSLDTVPCLELARGAPWTYRARLSPSTEATACAALNLCPTSLSEEACSSSEAPAVWPVVSSHSSLLPLRPSLFLKLQSPKVSLF